MEAETVLVVLSGPPGVGKTTLARELARSLGAPHVRVDAFETALGLRDGDGDPTGYRLAHVVARDALRSGRHAVVDAVNPVRAARDGWRSLAVEVGVPLLEVDVTCSDQALHERRVRERTPDLPGQRVPTWADVTARHPWQRDADEPGAVVVDTATTALVRSVADLRARAEATPRQVAVPASLLAPTHRLGSWAARGEPEVVLTTERLLLRRWRETDLEPFAAMGRDRDVMAHLPGVLDRAASDGLARYADACFEAHGFGLSALERRSDGAFLGFCGLARHRRRPDQVEVGWRLARSAWGHGYATEAARAWLDAAGRVHGLTRVECYVAVDNARSLAVAGRLGLVRDAQEDWDGVPVVVHATPRTPVIMDDPPLGAADRP